MQKHVFHMLDGLLEQLVSLVWWMNEGFWMEHDDEEDLSNMMDRHHSAICKQEGPACKQFSVQQEASAIA